MITRYEPTVVDITDTQDTTFILMVKMSKRKHIKADYGAERSNRRTDWRNISRGTRKHEFLTFVSVLEVAGQDIYHMGQAD